MKVFIDEFKVPKKTHFGTFMKSTCQDKVYVWSEETNNWLHCGYIGHESRTFAGLLNFPHELAPAVVAECSKQKGYPIKWGGAPADPLPEPEDEFDELVGEAEE